MSPAEIPDRRPLLYIIMGVVIAAIATVLFWPHGEKAAQPDMVLTPESVQQASEMTTDLETAAPASEDAEVPQDPFTVTDATLPDDIDATPVPTQTPVQTPVSRSVSTATSTSVSPSSQSTAKPTKPVTNALDSALPQPTASGDYIIYVGSYSDRANAQRAASELTNKGIRAQVLPAGTKYRVGVGYFTSEAKAETYAKSLKAKLGLDYWVTEAN